MPSVPVGVRFIQLNGLLETGNTVKITYQIVKGSPSESGFKQGSILKVVKTFIVT
jgi:hypothetical protein